MFVMKKITRLFCCLTFVLLLFFKPNELKSNFVPGAFNGWTQNTAYSTDNMPTGFKKYTAQTSNDAGFKLLIWNNNWNAGWGSGYWINSWNTVWNINYTGSGLNDAFVKEFGIDQYMTIITSTSLGEATSKFGFLKTSAAPVYISSVSGGTLNVNTNSSVSIDITLSASKCAEEYVLIRYTTDNWSTSSIISASGSGTAYSATIPGQAANTTVNWYALTSTVANPTTDPDYLTLSVMNNNGSNYSYFSGETTATDYFRSKTTGNWSSNSSWESSSNGSSNWVPATSAPGSTANTITLLTGNIITLDENKSVGNLAINSGSTLEISAGKQLTVGTALTNNGTLTLKSTDIGGTASIITSGTVSGSGTTEVEQYISSTATGTTGRNWYISSPLSAATSSTITTETGNGLVYWNGSAWTDAGTTMDVMKGYIAKSPNGNKTIKFTGGNLNTGDKSVENLALGFNLIGNPYASWVKFSEASKTNIATTIWFRSKSTGSYVFQTFNTSGSVSVNGGTDIIPPMQAFWIKTTNATNSFGFLNTNRTHQTDNKLKIPAINSNELLRLQIGGAGLENDETVVYFNQNAQDTFDNYDSEKMFNNSSVIPEIYTTANDNKLVINGLHNSYAGLELALGFNTNVNTNYNFQIKATEIQNLENYKIVLVDKVAGEEIVLSDGLSYQFVSNSTSGSDRFTILFKTAEGTTGEFIDNNSTGITVYSNNKNIKLNCNKTLHENARVSLYNSVGQVIHNQSISSSSTILNKEFENGIYLLKIENGGKTEVLRTIVK